MRITIILFLIGVAHAQYWTASRAAEVAVYGGAISLDSWISQQPNFVEQDPVAKPFVRAGMKGQILGSSLGFVAGVGPSYLLYRFGHRRLASGWLHLFTAAETVNAADMLYKYETRP
jgi:hypothetical protein